MKRLLATLINKPPHHRRRLSPRLVLLLSARVEAESHHLSGGASKVSGGNLIQVPLTKDTCLCEISVSSWSFYYYYKFYFYVVIVLFLLLFARGQVLVTGRQAFRLTPFPFPFLSFPYRVCCQQISLHLPIIIILWIIIIEWGGGGNGGILEWSDMRHWSHDSSSSVAPNHLPFFLCHTESVVASYVNWNPDPGLLGYERFLKRADHRSLLNDTCLK